MTFSWWSQAKLTRTEQKPQPVPVEPNVCTKVGKFGTLDRGEEHNLKFERDLAEADGPSSAGTTMLTASPGRRLPARVFAKAAPNGSTATRLTIFGHAHALSVLFARVSILLYCSSIHTSLAVGCRLSVLLLALVSLVPVDPNQPLASPKPSTQIMCAEMLVNGGIIMLGDHCGKDADKTNTTATISHEVGKDEAGPLAKSFADNGGEIMEEPSMQFWGQGEDRVI